MHLRSGKQRETLYSVCKSISCDYAAPVMAEASWAYSRNDVFRFLICSILYSGTHQKAFHFIFVSQKSFLIKKLF